MELTEDQIVEKHAKKSGHCARIVLLCCISCNYKAKKRKNEPSKLQRKRMIFLLD